MRPATSIQELRDIARRRIPRAIFDYADGGSYSELTLAANRRDLDDITLFPRVMVDVSGRSLATDIAGQAASMPLGIAPTGLAGLFHPDGEICEARAAAGAGIPFCLSTLSINSIEEVRRAVETPFWFQLYVMKDQGFTHSLIERAKEARCSALMVTLDLQVQGQRNRDRRNGLTVPPRLTFSNLADILSKPAWALGVLRTGRTFGNLADWGGATKGSLPQWLAGQFDDSLCWKDIEDLRSLWPGKLILKGVSHPADARHAVRVGADAIVVSNHGGRQLDSAPSSISVLKSVVDAVDEKAEVMFDGGVTSGQDILKALALGAKAALIGRAALFGLAARGQAGVSEAIELIRRELSVSMALTGVRDVRDVPPSVLR